MDILRSARFAICVALVTGAPHPTQAKVDRIEIASRAPVLDGKSFGDVGPYEKIVGKVFF